MLSSGLSLGRQEGGEEQGGTSQGREGGGGEVKQPAGHLTVLAWRGAAAGRAWGAGEGAWDPAPGGHRGERGCSWSPWGLEGCGGSPTVLSTLLELMLQAGRRVRHQATYFLLRCCLAPRSPCPPSGLRSRLAAKLSVAHGCTGALARPLAGTWVVSVGGARLGLQTFPQATGMSRCGAQPCRAASCRCSGSWRWRGRRRTSWSDTAGCTSACAAPRRSSSGNRPPSCWPWARASRGLCCSSPSLPPCT